MIIVGLYYYHVIVVIGACVSKIAKTLVVFFEFDEVNQAIFFMGLQVGTVQRIGKDEALLESDLIQDGKIYRVKGIK